MNRSFNVRELIDQVSDGDVFPVDDHQPAGEQVVTRRIERGYEARRSPQAGRRFFVSPGGLLALLEIGLDPILFGLEFI